MIQIFENTTFKNGISNIRKAKKNIETAIQERFSAQKYANDSELLSGLSTLNSISFYGVTINDVYEFENGMLKEKKCDDPSKFRTVCIPDKYDASSSAKEAISGFLDYAFYDTDCVSKVDIRLNSLCYGLCNTFSKCKNLTDATFDIENWYIKESFIGVRLSSYAFYGDSSPTIFYGGILQSTERRVRDTLKNVFYGCDSISSISFPKQTVSQMRFLFFQTVNHDFDDPNYFNEEHYNYFGLKFERQTPVRINCSDGHFYYSLDSYIEELNNPANTIVSYQNGIDAVYRINGTFKNDSVRNVEYVEKIKFGNTITSIEDEAFGLRPEPTNPRYYENNYKNLKRIFFSNTISSIDEDCGMYSYNAVPSLSEIDVENISSFFIAKNNNSFAKSWNLYENGTKVEEAEITNEMGSLAFYNCQSIKRLSAANDLTSIKWGTFSYCNNLSSLTMSESVTSFALNSYANLKEINVPSISSWLKINFEGSVFNEDTKLLFEGNIVSSVQYPSSQYEIKQYTFSNYSYLTAVYANQLNKIGKYAFYNCKNLNIAGTKLNNGTIFGQLGEVSPDDQTIEVESCAFKNCKKLNQFPVRKLYSLIGSSAFENVVINSSSITTIGIGYGAQTHLLQIASNAFSNLKFMSSSQDKFIKIYLRARTSSSSFPTYCMFAENIFSGLQPEVKIQFQNQGDAITMDHIKNIRDSLGYGTKTFPWGSSEEKISLLNV